MVRRIFLRCRAQIESSVIFSKAAISPRKGPSSVLFSNVMNSMKTVTVHYLFIRYVQYPSQRKTVLAMEDEKNETETICLMTDSLWKYKEGISYQSYCIKTRSRMVSRIKIHYDIGSKFSLHGSLLSR